MQEVFRIEICTSQPTCLPVVVLPAMAPWGLLRLAQKLQPGMQKAWGLYPEPWLTLGMQWSTAEPHPWILEPSDGLVMEMQANMGHSVQWRGPQ